MKINKILIYFIFILLNSISQNALSQNNTSNTPTDFLPKITPPSPTSFAVANYGNVPTGLFTGTLNLQIPIHNFISGKITVPINLFYGSNGVKVDDVSGSLGLGWNMNAGGIITRTVRDEADENQVVISVPENISGSSTNSSITNAFFSLAGLALADTERDIYSFNFNGYSGKFIFDRDENPILYSKQNLSISRFNGTGFLVTTENGSRYYFTEIEKSKFRTFNAGQSIPNSYETGWLLTKIINSSGDEVYFEYENQHLMYTASQSQSLNFLYPSPQLNCNNTILMNAQNLSLITGHNMQVYGKRIKTIKSNKPEEGSIRFKYDETNDDEKYNKLVAIFIYDQNLNEVDKINFNHFTTSNKRTFLQNINYKDPNKNYSFSYINPTHFPERLDLGQDHWGYYNGKANINLVPKNLTGYNIEYLEYEGADKEPNSISAETGMLNKIIYPTKGQTEIEYEGNNYFGEKTVQPPVKRELLQVDVLYNQPVRSVQKEIPIQMDQWVEISGRSFFNSYCDPENTGHLNSTLTIKDESGNAVQLWKYSTTTMTFVHSENNLFTTDYDTFFIDAKAGKTYTIILTTYRCTSANCTITYKNGAPSTTMEFIPTGGVRVKSTMDKSGNGISNYKKYIYSDADPGKKPVYFDQNTVRTYCSVGTENEWLPCNFRDNTYLIVNSSSLFSLFDTGSSNCYYGSVNISHGGDNYEKGGENRTFTISRDYWANQIQGSTIWSAPWTNFGWDNGNEIYSSTFDSHHNPIQKVWKNYRTKDVHTKEVKSYSVRKNYEINCNITSQHHCTNFETTNYPQNPCFGQPVNKLVQLNDVSNLDIAEYKAISTFSYLQSQTTEDYLDGAPLITTTEYFFDNPNHYQLTDQRTIFPDGSSQLTNYKYAHEKGKTLMIQKNMVGIPLETSTTKGSKLLSKTLTDYPDVLPDTQTGNLLLPRSTSSLDMLTGGMSTDVTYNQYDSKGNLQQYTTRSGVTTAIVWGYNNTQPIAKIEGATYSQVSGLAGTIVTASDTDASAGVNNDETSLLDIMKTFREALPNNNVTTYTYDPLVGVRSITPPNGIRQVYIYDNANRLKEVRENSQTGSLLKEYQYNYKH